MNAPDKSQAWKNERKKPPLRRNTFGWLYLIVAPTCIFAIWATVVRTYLGPAAKSGVVLNWASLLTLLVLLALSVPLTIIRRRRHKAL